MLARFRRCRSGSAAVEFSIVGLLFLMMSVGVIEFGRAMNVRSDILRAVDIAERTVLLDGSATDSEIIDALRSAFDRGDPASMTVAVSTETVSGVSFRRIQVSYPLQLYLVNYPQTVLTFAAVRRVPVG